MLEVGSFLSDRYEILSKVGAGGMSDVYKAKDHILSRFVAIKVLKQEFSEDSSFVTKFRAEAQSAAGLEHPNIVNIYDVGSENGLYYIVMEYVEGITLKTYIEKKGQLSFKESASIAIQVARGIESAHNKNIIHRDIKPENVLMTSTDDNADIRILDFGLSKILGPNEYCNEPYGTLSYVAPEVLLEKPYNKAVDMWSLGVTTYLLLSGGLPFDHANDDKEIARQTISEPVPYKGTIWKTISPQAVDFINKLLVKDQNQRMTVKDALEHEWIKRYKNKANRSSINSNSEFKLYSFAEE